MDRLFGRKKHAASPDGPSASSAAASPSSAASAPSVASASPAQQSSVGPPPLLANDPTYNEAILHLNAALRLEDAGADFAAALVEYDIGLQLALGLLKRLPRPPPAQQGAGAAPPQPVDPSVEKARDLLRGVIDKYMTKAEQLKQRKLHREGAGPPPSAVRAQSNGAASAASPALRSAPSSASPVSSVASPSSASAASASAYKANIDPALRAAIESEILVPSASGTAVSFKDILGMQDVKDALNEMVILPSLRPDLFSGLRAPPRGLLLYGPPGNGKSFVAAAVASESKCTFFSVSAATLVSKHLGEGERLVRALFSIARERSPSIIFVDEIDSILSRRSSEEHEASRRLKTEFLVSFDGIAGKNDGDSRVIVLAATNCPEDLDEALIRRMQRRIYIPSPDAPSRRTMLASMLNHPSLVHALSKAEVERLVLATDGYSNSDLKALVSDAALGPLRSLSSSQLLSTPADQLPAVQWSHFESALHKIRPSVSKERLMEYEKWSKKQEGGR